MQQESRSLIGDKCRNAGRGLQNESKAVGGEREGEEETVRGEDFPEELHEGGCEEVAVDGSGPCKSVRSATSGTRAY